ncbi:MAG TPA: DUF2158 domain-containing protein [Chitinophagaceae bacterium]|nr:DUF2158 domain-containing protein [Chitinophagaceae bacterium]
MANKFKAGDIVQLKSGSHGMTIKGHATTHTPEGNIPIADKYECSWFDGVKPQKAVFKEDTIKLVQALV